MKTLETLLREDAAAPLDGHEFTARVMAALPPARATPAWIRPALVMGSAVGGSAIAFAFAPRDASFAMSVAEFFSAGLVSPALLASLAIGGVLLLSGVVLALDSE